MLSGFFHPPSFCANVSLTLLAKTKNSRLDFFNVYLIKSYLGEAACSATPKKSATKLQKKNQANKSTNLFLSNLQSICDDGIHASAKVNGCHLKKGISWPRLLRSWRFRTSDSSSAIVSPGKLYPFTSLEINNLPVFHAIMGFPQYSIEFSKTPSIFDDFWRHDE